MSLIVYSVLAWGQPSGLAGSLGVQTDTLSEP